VWNTTLEVGRSALSGHKDTVSSAAFSPDGKRLVSGSWDTTIKVWDVESGAEVMTLRGDNKWVTAVAFSLDGTRIASGGEGKTITVWDLNSGSELMSFHGHNDYIDSLTFSSDGKHIVSGGGEIDKTVKVWDAATGKELTTLRGHTGSIDSVAISPDGKRILSGGCQDANGNSDGTIRVWDIKSGADLMTRKHGYGVFSVAFSPDGKRVASGGSDADKTIKVWDAGSGAEIMTLYGHQSGINSIAFSPDGKRIVSGSRDGTVKLWDTVMKTEVMTLPAQNAVWSSAFSSDGRTIAISDGNMVTLFESAVPAGGYEPRKNGEAARKIVDELYQKYGFYYEVIDKISADKTLDEPIRKLALQIANSRKWEDADKLRREALEIVSSSGKSVDEYRTALEKAEKANSWEPNDPGILNTLGAAQYRLGSYEDALKTLAGSARMLSDGNEEPDPGNVAFTAMTFYKVAQVDQAKVALERLRELCRQEHLDWDTEVKALLAEAEKLITGEKQ
jgi:tricorn protease-like protein